MAGTDARLDIGSVEPAHELLAGRSSAAGPSGVVVTIHVDDADDADERAKRLGAEIATSGTAGATSSCSIRTGCR